MANSSLTHGPQLTLTGDDPADAVAALVRAAADFPAAGVRTPAGLLTYPDLLDRARRILTGLRAAGASSGDRVIVQGLSLDDFFPAFWACLLGGIQPAVVGEQVSPGSPVMDRLRHTWDLLDAPIVLTDRAGAAVLDGDGFLLAVVEDLLPLPPADELHRPGPGEVALLMLSSGSTGAPKAAALTHRGLAEFAAGSRRLLDVRPGETMLNWLPVDHSGALLLYHVLPVFTGSTNVHLPTADVLANPLLWLEKAAQYGVAHAWSPTFGLQLSAEALAARPDLVLDLGGVRSLVSGGEQIVLPVVDRFFAATARAGLDRESFRPAWGMAETVTAITIGSLTSDGGVVRVLKSSVSGELVVAEPSVPDADCTTFVAVGPPAPGATARIVDADDQVLPELRIGRLQLKSARVTAGYVNNPSATAAALPDGEWLRTGDLAFVAAGQVVVTGREGDTVVLNGHTLFCHEIEEVVGGVEGLSLRGVGVCGVPNSATGTEDLVVFFEDSGLSDDVVPAIRAALFRRLRLTAGEVVRVPAGEFPRTASGKVRRTELRRLHEAGRYSATDVRSAGDPAEGEAPSAAGVGVVVRRVVGELVGRPVVGDMPFYELGLTSITIARLRAQLAGHFGIDVPATVPFEHPTANALTNWLVSHLGAEANLRPDTGEAVTQESPRVEVRAAGGEAKAVGFEVGAVDRRVAVVGMAARFPGARTVAEYWANLTAGVDSVSTFDVAGGPDQVGVGGVLEDAECFDGEFFGLSPKEAALTDAAHRQFLEVAHEVLEHGGYASADPGLRIGVYAGTGMNLYGHQDQLVGAPVTDVPTAMQATIGATADFLATRAAYRLGLTGPAIGVQTACSTSLVAVHLAVQALLDSDADLAIAGAAAVRLPQEAGYRHVPGSILSPTGRCRPFDAAADGTVGGNGVAAVLLKRLDRALADGDTVHAVILGSAVNNDGTSKVGFTAPSVSGQVDVVSRALDRAGVGPETISYVEAHGTGTALGDPVEFEALSRVFGTAGRTAKCALGSVKANVGHLDSCAGMAGLIKTILMLQHGRLVPTLNLQQPHPELRIDDSPFELTTAAGPWTAGVRRAGVSALGVGGTNAHLVLEQPPLVAASAEPVEAVVVPVSAKSAEALAELSDSLRSHLLDRPELAAVDVATTMARGRRHYTHRRAVVGADAADLAEALAKQPEQTGSGPLTFAYTGQGSTYPGMSDWLYRRFDPARRVFDEIERALGVPVLEADGEHAQVALFANQAAWTEVWRSLGVVPDFVVGHSVGEYAAMYAAGVLSLVDGASLTARRGELMYAGVQPGVMVAVAADLALAERIAAESGVEVAAVNGRDRVVLSGAEDAMARATGVLDVAGLTWRRMGVDRAFHSAMVEPMLDELRAWADGVSFGAPRLPVFGGVDGALLTAVDGRYLVDHARRAVRFDLVVGAVGERGGSRFLEVGPDAVLSAFGRRALPGSTWVASQRKESDEQFAQALAALYGGGSDVDWSMVSAGRRIPLPGHPLVRRRYDGGSAQRPEPVQVAAAKPVLVEGVAVLDRVKELVAPSLGMAPAEVPADSTFLSLGADSLSLMRLVGELDEVFGVAVPVRRLFSDADTPAKLTALLDGSPAAAALAPAPAPAPAPALTPSPALAPAAAPAAALALTPAPAPATKWSTAVASSPVAATRGACDFSLYFFGDYPDAAAHDKYGLILRATEFADERGFHAVWLPERHFHSFGALFPNPSVLAAALATRTQRIRLHAGSVVLPLHHPIRVAEEWSVVDNLSGGRAGICVASGWHARDFVFAPDSYGKHREQMYEHLDTVRKLWAGGAITATAGNGELTEVRLHPSPLQDEPPLYAAVVGNPESYKLAARNDIGVVTNLMAQSVEDLAANIALYRATRAEHGLDPEAGRVVVLVHTYLGDDLDAAREAAYQPFCDYLRSSLSLFGQVTNSLGFQIDLDKTPDDDVDFLLGQAYQRYCESRALIGTADSSRPIVDALLAAGANEVACFVDFGLSPEQVMESLTAVDALREEYGAKPVADDPGRALTPPERRIWFLEQLNPGANTYHEPKAIELHGPLDPIALHGALQKVVDRHPALRTTFREVDGEPRAFVAEEVTIECPVAEGNDLESVLRDVRLGDLDPAAGPLVRAQLVRLAEDHHVLLLVAHHIVFDSPSTPVLARDLGAFYRSWPQDPDLPPAVDGLTVTSPQSTDVDFWVEHLAGAPELQLPSDRLRPRKRSGQGRSATHDLDRRLTEQVTTFSGRTGVTVFSTLLAGLSVVLARFSGQSDFVLGTGVSGRGKHAADSIGMFVDTLPLRVQLPANGQFAAFTRDLGLALMDAVDHRDLPFEDIVAALNPDRSAGRNPLFGVAVEFESGSEQVSFAPPTVAATLLDLPSERAPLDLVLYLTYQAGGIKCVVEYDTDLYDETTVRRLLDYFETTLDLATTGPAVPITDLAVLTAGDRRLLAQLEGESGEAPTICLHELFEQQADRQPEAIAITGAYGDSTYAELEQQANRIAAELLNRGVRPGQLVAICLPRGPGQIAALLGVLKSGAAFLPLDPAVPTERLRFLVDDAGAVVVVTAEGMPELGDQLRIDRLDGTSDRPVTGVTAHDLAYCIYTSGSTGTPKGVLVPHRGTVNHVLQYVAKHPGTTTLQWASPQFDSSLHEIFTALAAGQALVLIEDATRYDVEVLAATIDKYQVQRIVMPFSAVHSLLAAKPSLPSLREIYAAGEATTPTATDHEFLAAHPDCVLYNGYGPTEASVGVTEHRSGTGETAPPIGRPIPGVRLRLLDGDRRPVPVGAVGEICAEGNCVTDGYLNRPAETAAAFFAPDSYATGDLGRWRADGALEFHGRRDDQVKIRGARIEPGEIRAAVLDHALVTDAAVLAMDGELVGYIVGPVGFAELTEHLSARLPQYLVPRRWVRLDRLPLASTGKLDRAALPAPDRPRGSAAPSTPTEHALHAVWCEVLGVDAVGVDDSFFALGGHSLLAVRLLNGVRETTGAELTLTEFFREPTLRAVARAGVEPSPREEAVVRSEEAGPLTFAQRRALGRHRARTDATVYNGITRVDVTGDLDPERLRTALQALTDRHTALRTRVFDDQQMVLATVPIALPVHDLPDDEEQIQAWCVAAAQPAMDPEQAPLWRVRIGRVSADRWVLVVVVHHLVYDGWSSRLFWQELSALYAGDELAPATAQFTDYARWERDTLTGETRTRLETFWRTTLAGATLRPNLPLDHSRPAALSGEGATHHVTLPHELAAHLRTRAAQAGTTPYVVIAAAFARWLGGISGDDEVVLPASSARRSRPEHDGVIGYLGEAVLVRVRLDAPDLLTETAEALYAALDHEALPLSEVVRTAFPDQTTSPYPAVLFTVITTPPATLTLPSGEFQTQGLNVPGHARTELYVVFTLTDESFTLDIEYATDLFTPTTIATWAAALVATLTNQ
ncbi:non-ribosomal peptide synthetase/type I polyketide synthase [Kribbella italica]|uniref:Natural product biosynthesis luciferase-like monooxygenase protein/amino acid adenylation domain-containing protein n=1 Tax=Kribbella italica TaxID=1540520 RepID=A0A7W9JA42_9ACTN|nr:non-ribosomal peptide synthetase/type I polyketide synthase [Kribbella italica]MBB5838414.1 natural product biosynthesis luciferase-like monooxygenase protein/amino acid adenylation domain-containing protein [Kribbella italica]